MREDSLKNMTLRASCLRKQKLFLILPMSSKVDELLRIRETINDIEQTAQLISDKYVELLVKIYQEEREVTVFVKRLDLADSLLIGKEMSKLKDYINFIELYAGCLIGKSTS